jgi:hypothetical protein
MGSERRRSDLSERRERLVAWLLLALLGGMFVAYCTLFVPRLTNTHFGDVEFTGWSGPIGSRVLHGERPYVDFVLPIPPGSFVVLGAIEQLAGRTLLLHELWANALMQLAMSIAGYAIAVRVTTRENALLVALTTLVALLWLNKECAYDHTAQLVVWTSFVTGVRALLEPAPARRARFWMATGLIAAFTLAFKQSTGTGALLGWGAALGYLLFFARVSKATESLAARLADVRAWLIGVVGGVLLLWLLLVSLGSSFVAYAEAVFVDGPKLKGGSLRLIKHVLGYLTIQDAWLSSIAFTLGLCAAGARIVRFHGGLHAGDEPVRKMPLTWLRAALIAVAIVTPFAVGIGVLLSKYSAFRPGVVEWLDRMKFVPHLGLVFAIGFALAHLLPIAGRAESVAAVPSEDRVAGAPSSQAVHVGHALNALFIATLATSLFHNTSAPELRAFYDNNPIIPVAFLVLFVGLDRARLLPIKALLVVLTLSTLFGNRFERAMAARYPVGSTGHWAGMKVSDRGRDIARAALRVRQLASPDESVLVLPEDVQLAALIGRPRPKFRGAIVFVDQYPERLLTEDLPILARDLPKVVVLHPAEPYIWVQLFRIWSGDSGAQRMLDYTMKELLPKHYRKDAVIETRWLWRDSTLEIWVRDDERARPQD